MTEKRKLRLTLVKSPYNRKKGHAECVRGLGLRRIRQTVQVVDTPENRGMVNKINYLLDIQELSLCD